MLKFSTKNITLFFVMTVGLLFFGSSKALAQDYFIEITNAPDATLIGTKYPCSQAAWSSFCENGAPNGTFITHVVEPILASPAPLAPIPDNKVGVCRRGTFNHTEKARNIKSAGGVGMLEINNTAGLLAAFGTNEVDLTDFGIMVEQKYDAIFTTVSGIEFKFGKTPDVDIVFWGDNPGQGDFNGGIGDWTSTAACFGGKFENAGWHWSINGASSGAFGSNVIASPSACNGAMYFQSDSLDSGGTAQAAGPCLAPQVAELISPTIDLSHVPKGTGLSIRFSSASRQFQSDYFVCYSNDDGATWDSTEINSDLVVNDNFTTKSIRVSMTGIEPTDKMKIRFRYQANYYFWVIDDVKIVKLEDNNVRLDGQWMATPVYPTNSNLEITPNYWMTDVANIGNKPATGVTLNVNIKSSTGEVAGNYDLSYGTINPGDTIQNKIVNPNNPFMTPSTPGDYTITYSVKTDSTDFNPADNTKSYQFRVTDKGTHARDLGSTSSNSLVFDAGVSINWVWGSIYREEGSTPNLASDSVTIGLGNPADLAVNESPIEVYIFEFPDVALDDNTVNSTEFTLVGTARHTPTSSDPANLIINLPVLDPLTDEPTNISLKPGHQYTVSIVYIAPETNPNNTLFLSNSNAFNHRPTEFTQLDPSVTAGTYRPASYLQTPFTASSDLILGSSRSLFSGAPVPIARLLIKDHIGNNQTKLSENTVRVYPTVTKNTLNVAFDFAKNSNTKIQVIDMKGNIVLTKSVNNVSKQNINLELGNLSNGTYNLKVSNEEGMLTKNFIIAK